ncbi:hypothetical protein CHS0354_011560 [Potamilus streckersoni]|uniref:Coiled-coil domain-containing protein 60 n=1 Tax=Potamilus streckersoni TaxID=2493646 RepID=A0AAE0RR69_9BIVA|nr:hypothetical protein CHS0354_011560 [Potamilus streckersoni]
MPPKEDPRIYVRQLPLPIASQKGLKIQARSIEVYNPAYPTRDIVRKENFERRKEQLMKQGFRSKNYEPYIGIGDPFFLEEKKLILHALGQWNEASYEQSSSSSEEEEDEDEKDKLGGKKPVFTAAKFVLRRSRKDLNTVNKEVTHGRNMIRNVRLGHGLFDLIEKEKQAKKAQQEAENQRKREQARNEWQPPKLESDGEEGTDDDLDQEADLSRMALAENEEEWRKTQSAMLASRATSAVSRPGSMRKKKAQTPRPYTPQHTSIYSREGYRLPEDISRDALFRQLCVLHWILDAMSTDPPSTMMPITSSWSLTDIGGSKAPPQKKKTGDIPTWTNFISSNSLGRLTLQPNEPKISKRLSTSKGSKMLTRRSFMTGSKTPTSPGVQTVPATPTSQMALMSGSSHFDSGHSGRAISSPTQEEEEEDISVNKSIFKFLDEYYESLKKEEEQTDDKEKEEEPASPLTQEKRKKEKRHKDGEDKDRNKSKKSKKSPEDIKLEDKSAMDERVRSARYLRADAHMIRPKSSPALKEFQDSLPSNIRSSMPSDMNQKFSEVREDKALLLHDQLDHKERQRMPVCHTKFKALVSATTGSSFHRAVTAMRSESARMLRQPRDQRKKSQMKGNWYTDIVENIPDEIKEEWQYQKILKKLARFGLVEGSGKHSIYKFMKVLQTLREWEICSPDVTAAIEFCRERIVEMTIEEYEEWFQQRFPKVTRPQTAPPTIKTDKGKDKYEGAVDSKPRAVQSAFVRRTQK